VDLIRPDAPGQEMVDTDNHVEPDAREYVYDRQASRSGLHDRLAGPGARVWNAQLVAIGPGCTDRTQGGPD
jgi:hypothetical protein